MKKTSSVAGVALALLLPGIAGAADGCPPGSVSTTPSGAGAFSVLFSAFTTDRGTVSSCRVSVATGSTSGGKSIRVYSADYRGVVTLAPGDRATLTTRQEALIDSRRFAGPYDGDLATRAYVGTNDAGNIESIIALDLQESADPFAFGAVDSADYALVATAERADLARSIRNVADERVASVIGIQSLASILTGASSRIDDQSHIGVVGGAGSPFIGANGRIGFTDTVSVSGGAAVFKQKAGGTDLEGLLASGSVRYLPAGNSPMKPFVEGAMRLSALDMELTRTYATSSSAVTSNSQADGWLAGGTIKAGLVMEPDQFNQIVVAASYSADWMRFGNSAEAFGADNLFAASFGKSTGRTDTVKADAAWTTRATDQIDIGLNAGVGVAFARKDLQAGVAFAGDLDRRAERLLFATYGAQVDFRPTERLTGNVYVQGVMSSEADITPRFGGSLSLSF